MREQTRHLLPPLEKRANTMSMSSGDVGSSFEKMMEEKKSWAHGVSPSFPAGKCDGTASPDEASEGAAMGEVGAFGVGAPEKLSFPAVDVNYAEIETYPPRPHFHQHHHSMRPATQLVCFDGCQNDPYHPAAMPLYQTATFVQPSSTEFGPMDYTRSGNPTRVALETLVAGLEQAHTAFAFTSGMAALGTVARLITAGQKILASADLYGGMHRLLSQISVHQGIAVEFVDTSDLSVLAAALTPDVGLVHIESPSNPLMRITDLRRAAEIVHKANPNALVSVDSTMMSPHLCRPLLLGVDIVVHSATKFLSGHSDTMAGVVCVSSETLAKRVAFLQNAEGTALAPFDCWMILRSIKTLALRVERSQENAEAVAAFLSRHPAVKRLHYAGPIPDPTREENLSVVPFPSTKRWGLDLEQGSLSKLKTVNISSSFQAHKLHMTQARGGGSVVSFETGSVEFSRRVVDALRLFKITVSFGSCNSLVEMPCTLSHASIPAEKRTLPADLIRISVGIEDVWDILEDLERAFWVAASEAVEVRKETKNHRAIRQELVDAGLVPQAYHCGIPANLSGRHPPAYAV